MGLRVPSVNYMSTGVVMGTTGYMPTRDDDLRTVEETLRRLNLTPEEAIKLVSKHLAAEKAAQ
jgi:hypothetical protein